MADWLKNHPLLYTKTMKEYKVDLWNEKAKELNIESGSMIKTWYESVPTKVGGKYGNEELVCCENFDGQRQVPVGQL